MIFFLDNIDNVYRNSRKRTGCKIMRNLAIYLLLLALITGIACKQGDHQEMQGDTLKGSIAISGAWALYPLAVLWADEFREMHPGVRIEISAGGAGKGMADVLSGLVDIGMVSREIYPVEIEQGAFYFPVAIDAVVPTMNAGNPVIAEIQRSGLKKEDFERLWIGGEEMDWGSTAGLQPSGQINIYTRSDACGAAATLAAFFGKSQEDLRGIGIFGDPGMVTAVRDDIMGIGYNNINFVYDRNTKKPVAGVAIIPIDLNNDGIISEDEDFYNDLDSIVKAISEGVYPSPPARELYFVTKNKPGSKLVREFLSFVLSEGQDYTENAGYVKVSEEKSEEGLLNLN